MAPWLRDLYWEDEVRIRHGSSHSETNFHGSPPKQPIGFRFPEAQRRDEMKELQEVYR